MGTSYSRLDCGTKGWFDFYYYGTMVLTTRIGRRIMLLRIISLSRKAVYRSGLMTLLYYCC